MRRRATFSLLAVLALLATGCQLRNIGPPGSGVVRYRDSVFAAVTKTADIVYGAADNQLGEPVTLTLDLYQPTGDTVTTRPVIVLVHGGSFRSGSKTSAELVDQANTYAKQGYVTASIKYRLSTNGCTSVTIECIQAIKDAKHDAQAAVRFLRANATTYKLDTTRVAMAGTSAGAITALEVGYGPEDVGTSGTPDQPSTIRAAVSLSGAKIVTTPNPGEAAALLFHGTADPLVSYTAATSTITAAHNAGLTAELLTWQGAGHVPYTEHRTEILTQTTNFLYWTMDLIHAAR